MPTYGQINSSNVLIGISHLSGTVDAPHMILIEGDAPEIGSTWTGSEWTAPIPVEPEPTAPIPSLYAIAQLLIDAGAVTSITPSAHISGAFPVDVGVYWVFFAEPLPDANYMVLCYNHGHSVHVSEQYEDFFVITATSGGVPSDPQCISVEVKRVV